MQFEQTALSREMQRAIQDMGFTEMTEVQEKTIPEMMEGKDVIAKAPTGTGKTCAFGVPIIERIDGESDALQCLILAPTRELTSQITEDMRAMAKYKEGLRIVSVYGGQSMQRQIEHLKKKPQIKNHCFQSMQLYCLSLYMIQQPSRRGHNENRS